MSSQPQKKQKKHGKQPQPTPEQHEEEPRRVTGHRRARDADSDVEADEPIRPHSHAEPEEAATRNRRKATAATAHSRADDDAEEDDVVEEHEEAPTKVRKADREEAHRSSKKRRRAPTDADDSEAHAADERATTNDDDVEHEQHDDDEVDDDQDGGETGEDDSWKRTVYLEGLPFTSTEDDIRAFLTNGGTVSAAAIHSIRAPRYHDTGRLLGYAHVELTTVAAARAAVKLDGRYIRDRFISVAAARAAGHSAEDVAMKASRRPRPAGCTTVFVKGLPYDLDEDGVRTAFGKFGKVLSVRLARWGNTHNTKGFGYVQFEHGYSADAAMAAYRAASPPLAIGGRVVRLDWDTGAPRAGFRTATNQHFFKTEEGETVKKGLKRHTRDGGAGAAAAGSRSAGASSAGASSRPSHKSSRESR